MDKRSPIAMLISMHLLNVLLATTSVQDGSLPPPSLPPHRTLAKPR